MLFVLRLRKECIEKCCQQNVSCSPKAKQQKTVGIRQATDNRTSEVKQLRSEFSIY